MSVNSENKTKIIVRILEKLVRNQEIYPSDTQLLDEFHITERTLRRYMDEIEDLFPKTFRRENKLMGYNKRPMRTLRVYDRNKVIIIFIFPPFL